MFEKSERRSIERSNSQREYEIADVDVSCEAATQHSTIDDDRQLEEDAGHDKSEMNGQHEKE